MIISAQVGMRDPRMVIFHPNDGAINNIHWIKHQRVMKSPKFKHHFFPQWFHQWSTFGSVCVVWNFKALPKMRDPWKVVGDSQVHRKTTQTTQTTQTSTVGLLSFEESPSAPRFYGAVSVPCETLFVVDAESLPFRKDNLTQRMMRFVEQPRWYISMWFPDLYGCTFKQDFGLDEAYCNLMSAKYFGAKNSPHFWGMNASHQELLQYFQQLWHFEQFWPYHPPFVTRICLKLFFMEPTIWGKHFFGSDFVLTIFPVSTSRFFADIQGKEDAQPLGKHLGNILCIGIPSPRSDGCGILCIESWDERRNPRSRLPSSPPKYLGFGGAFRTHKKPTIQIPCRPEVFGRRFGPAASMCSIQKFLTKNEPKGQSNVKLSKQKKRDSYFGSVMFGTIRMDGQRAIQVTRLWPTIPWCNLLPTFYFDVACRFG